MLIWTKTNFFVKLVTSFEFYFVGNRQTRKIIIVSKTLEKSEILMVLTLKFDKNLLRYNFEFAVLISYCFGLALFKNVVYCVLLGCKMKN